MNILIVDDEKKARETISGIIRLYSDKAINIREAASVQEAHTAITKDTPDLLLLDIQLRDGNGFDLLKLINTENISIIFITAFEEYAIRACKVSALNYLLKPVDPDELISAIAKAKQKVEKEKMLERMDTFIQNMSGTTPQIRKIALKSADHISIVNVSDITFCKGEGNYTTFHLVDKRKILVSKSLGEYEETIHNNDFLRVHQSYLVNMNHILRYERGEGGTIITINEEQIPVSTRKKEQVIGYLNNL